MLSDKEKLCNYETLTHIQDVRDNLTIIISEILDRSSTHDQSKLESPEVEILANAPRLDGIQFGSAEYEESKRSIKDALDHHYANNRHHPQFFKNGINDMNIIDLVEMFADWASSAKRNKNGNLRKSIEKNGIDFGISPQLIKIFENSIDLFE